VFLRDWISPAPRSLGQGSGNGSRNGMPGLGLCKFENKSPDFADPSRELAFRRRRRAQWHDHLERNRLAWIATFRVLRRENKSYEPDNYHSERIVILSGAKDQLS